MKMCCMQVFVIIMCSSFAGARNASAQINPYTFNEISFLVQEPGFGVPPIGTGGIYSSLQVDYSAVCWNPASFGVASSGRMYPASGHGSRNIETSITNIRSDNSHNATSLIALGLAGAADVYRGSLVFAAGYSRIQNYNSPFQYDAFTNTITRTGETHIEPEAPYLLMQHESAELNGQFSYLAAGGTVEVAKNILIGGTFSFWMGRSNYRQIYPESDMRNFRTVYSDDVAHYRRDTYGNIKTFGYEIILGVIYQYSHNIKLGAVLNSPRSISLVENWGLNKYITYESNVTEAGAIDPGTFKYQVKTPFVFGIGASYTFQQAVVSMGLQFTDWTQLRFRGSVPLDGASLPETSTNIKRTLGLTVTPKIGIEYSIPRIPVKVRAGFGLVPNPIKDTNSRSDQKIFTAGLRFNVDPRIGIDIAYRRGWWNAESYSDVNGRIINERHLDHHIFTSVYFRY